MVLRNTVQTSSHTAWACHSWSRRWQVESLPHSLGRPCHLAPERSTQRMPFNVRRSSVRCRPGSLGGGSKGAISVHWASARALPMAGPPVAHLRHSWHQMLSYIPGVQAPGFGRFGMSSWVATGFSQKVILSGAKNLSNKVIPFASLRVTVKRECKTYHRANMEFQSSPTG